jgi:hypothetical protein
VTDSDRTPGDEIDAADRRADVTAILVIFAALVLGALHFVSGWQFHF